MLRVGIVGATGYTGAELARLLAGHPEAEVTVATASGERAGARLDELFPSLRGSCEVVCQEFDVAVVAAACDFVFIAQPHGKALELVPPLMDADLKVCDLGADFRLRDSTDYQQWYKLPHTQPELLQRATYGLPEWQRERIKAARLVANPGCYPTSAILALAPFVAQDVVDSSTLIVDAASGTSGAGRSSFSIGMHHPEIAGDFMAYNVAAHRHTPEIEQGLCDAGGSPVRVTFTAHLLPIARGILSTCYAGFKAGRVLTTEAAHAILTEAYRGEPFVRIHPAGQVPRIKHVNGSNYCDIGVKVDERTGRLIVVSALDNLIKGAAGQAIQNMNLMSGFEETAGLSGAAVFP